MARRSSWTVSLGQSVLDRQNSSTYEFAQRILGLGRGWYPTGTKQEGNDMSIMDQLTKRQRAVYEFIRDRIRNRGYVQRCARSETTST